MDRVRALRGWAPVPTSRGDIGLFRWLLLDGNRHAVAGALLTFVFVSLLAIGTIWPIEMQQLLTEGDAVQTILNTLLGGIILLVSIVVSINSVVLSYDLTSLGQQRDRIDEAMRFRTDLDEVTGSEYRPTDIGEFLLATSEAIESQATALESSVESVRDEELAREVTDYATEVGAAARTLRRRLDRSGPNELTSLWLGLEFDYTRFLDRAQDLQMAHEDAPEDIRVPVETLVDLFAAFATGKEYFKTLYYGREFSSLSRTLVAVSLPAIVVNAASILAIDAGLFPDLWLFGLPPLVTFVAAIVTASLVPFVVLASFTLRAATVAGRTVAAGPFGLGD